MILLDPLARPVIGHRGASGSFPENTLLAFHQALQHGADGVEFDVRLTADGIPVVIHDATVDRTSDGRGRLSELPLAAVRELDAGRGERIPTLAEVLESIGEAPVIVEVKDVAAGPAVVAAIDAAGARDRVVVGAFGDRALAALRNAGITTAATRWEAGLHWLASRVGSSHGAGRYQGFAVSEYSGRLKVVDRRFVTSAFRLGKPVHVWTVDDVATARRLRALGVAGILTNFPARMRQLSSSS
jgi:glycerophosphoryl diester phosphodiesterase